MGQLAFISVGSTDIQVEFPTPQKEVLPGIPWGNVDGFPTLAYWAYRVFERRIEHKPIQYKLGKTLREEVAACLLGGHGIPASMGLATFEHLKKKGAYTGEVHSQERLTQWLLEPIEHKGKLSKYRFAKQKAKYLHSALSCLNAEKPPTSSGKGLRDWLLRIKGIGPKTASWVARNWLDADDVAILDIHIYRAGLLAKFFEPEMTVEKNYFELEDKFLKVATALGVSAAELDAVMWYEMQRSSSVHRLLSNLTHH
jgi:thermostable 8-oxoguanine DNA glycosylase